MSEGIAKMGVQEIYKILPHRYPFLFVDKILDLMPGKSGMGIKEITYNEHMLLSSPVLLIEAMAQVAGVILAYPLLGLGDSLGGERGLKRGGGDYAGYLIEVKDIAFSGDVSAGDRLILNLALIQKFGNLFRFDGRAIVGDKVVIKGELSIAVVKTAKSPPPPDNPPLPPFTKGG